MIVSECQDPSPGQTGFKMVVSADGGLEGTIGGGSIEKTMVDIVRKKLQQGDASPVIRKMQHQSEAETPVSGMICGGYQTVMALYLHYQDSDTIDCIITYIRLHQIISLHASEKGILCSLSYPIPSPQFSYTSDTQFFYCETLLPPPTVYIIGGGHVSLALSKILYTLDFRIVVMDDRPAADTMEKNNVAHQKIITSFLEVEHTIPMGPLTYAVIMTPSHRADELVLRQLIHKPIAYLGMMGSSEKITEIFTHLRKDGISDKALQSVHAPIGLPIYSHTPAEIAISIAAELILTRNGTTASQLKK